MSDYSFSTLVVTGDDAVSFLQAQLSSDIETIELDGAAYSAWLNAKGRVICLFKVTRRDDQILLRLPTDLVETVLARMTLFRFRAKVEFSVGNTESLNENEMQLQLRDGRAEIFAEQSEAFTAHMLNLDLLDIVSVKKGCYPGQEIVARTHFRGASKRRCRLFEADATVASGAKVSNGTRDIGEVVNAFGNLALAVVRIDALTDTMSVGDVGLTELTLPYSPHS
ncbi:MAG: hypothetical protein AAF351_12795 [Pseudomonadota bacterium]